VLQEVQGDAFGGQDGCQASLDRGDLGIRPQRIAVRHVRLPSDPHIDGREDGRNHP
jgi:hypothetical protein